MVIEKPNRSYWQAASFLVQLARLIIDIIHKAV